MPSKMYATSDTTTDMEVELTPHSVVVGDVNGQVSDVFGKLTKLHAKNNFAFAIIAGNLFADEATASDEQNQDVETLLHGKIEVPLPTYFSLGNRKLPQVVIEKLKGNEGELCPNLFILGRKVSVKTSDGFKLAAIGGVHSTSADEIMDEYDAAYTDQDVESAKQFENIDILITSDWPAEVRHGSKTPYEGDSPTGVRSISDLCSTLKPRYHFSASDAIYEREPFYHRAAPPRPMTRFLSLAPLNNAQKHKAVFAFSLEPNSPPPEQYPPGITYSPFPSLASKKRSHEDDTYTGNSFSFANGGGDRDYRPMKRRHRDREPNPSECFFCLAGSNIEAHMIASIGENAYMTVAKGPLSTKKTFPTLRLPLHMLIIPLSHTPTFAAIEDKESRQATLAEMQRFREALHSLITTKSTSGDDGEAQLGSVTWEISRGLGHHLHWQFLPISVDLVKRGLVEKAFEVEADNLSYPQFAKSENEIAEAEEGDYFKVMIWSEGSQEEMVLPLEKGFRFDLQFGRRVLGKLLDVPHRRHWKDCLQTTEEETADCETFKKMFEPYDFAAE